MTPPLSPTGLPLRAVIIALFITVGKVGMASSPVGQSGEIDFESPASHVEALSHERASTRKEALRMLWHSGAHTPELLEACFVAALDDEQSVAGLALQMLFKALPETEDRLFALLEDPKLQSPSVILAAISWQPAEGMSDEQLAALDRSLRQRMNGASSNVVSACRILLRWTPDRQNLVTRTLELATEHEDHSGSYLIASLHPFGETLRPHLGKLLELARRPECAFAVCNGLRSWSEQDPDIHEALASLLRSPVEETRAAAAHRIRHLDLPTARRLLDDPSARVRSAMLSRTDDVAAELRVEAVLPHVKEVKTRYAATRWLKAHGAKDREPMWRFVEEGSSEAAEAVRTILLEQLLGGKITELTEEQARLLLTDVSGLHSFQHGDPFDRHREPPPRLPAAVEPVLQEWAMDADRSNASKAIEWWVRAAGADPALLGDWIRETFRHKPVQLSAALRHAPAELLRPHVDLLIEVTMQRVHGAAEAWVRVAAEDGPAAQAMSATLTDLDPDHDTTRSLLQAIASQPEASAPLTQVLSQLDEHWSALDQTISDRSRDLWANAMAVVERPTLRLAEELWQRGAPAAAVAVARHLPGVPDSIREGLMSPELGGLGVTLMASPTHATQLFGAEIYVRSLRRLKSWDMFVAYPHQVVYDVLDEGLRSADPVVRSQTLQTIAELLSLWWIPQHHSLDRRRSCSWRDQACAALSENDIDVLRSAIRALGGFGPAARHSVPKLLQLAEDASLRDDIAWTIRRIGRSAIAHLEDSSAPYAAEWSQAIQADEASPFIADVMRQNPRDTRRRDWLKTAPPVSSRECALRLLRLREDPEAFLEGLLGLSGHGPATHRSLMLSMEQLEASLVAIVSNPAEPPERRVPALRALAHSTTPEAANALESILATDHGEASHGDWVTAAYALAGRGTESLPALERALASAPDSSILQAAATLGEPAVPFLRRVATNTDSRLGMEATRLLRAMGVAGESTLLEQLHSEDATLVERAATQLGRPPQSGAPFLNRLRHLAQTQPTVAIIRAWLGIEEDETQQIACVDALLQRPNGAQMLRDALGRPVTLSPQLARPVVEASADAGVDPQRALFSVPWSAELAELLLHERPAIYNVVHKHWRQQAPEGLATILQATEDPRWRMRAEAARVLGFHAREEAVEANRTLLHDPHAAVRATAFEALRYATDELETMLADDDPAVRRNGVELLRHGRQLPLFERALTDEDPEVRRRALSLAVSQTSLRPSADALQVLLQDDRVGIRTQSLHLAVRCPELATLQPTLESLLDDPLPEIVFAALPVLRKLESVSADCFPRLVQLLMDERSQKDENGRASTLRQEAARTLQHFDAAAQPALWDAFFSTSNERMRSHIGVLLTRGTPPPERWEARWPHLVRSSVTAFRHACGLEGAEPLLRSASREGVTEVRSAAPYALRQRAEFAAEREAALADPEPIVRRRALFVWSAHATLDEILERTTSWIDSDEPHLVAAAIAARARHLASLSPDQRRDIDDRLDHPSEEVRLAALYALTRREPSAENAPAICWKMLSDPTPKIREQARSLFARLRRPGSVSIPSDASDVLTDPSRWPEVIPLFWRWPEGAQALAWPDFPFDHEDPRVRVAAFQAASYRNSASSLDLDAVRTALQDAEPSVREAAASWAVEQVEPSIISELAWVARNDAEPSVARAAMEGLHRFLRPYGSSRMPLMRGQTEREMADDTALERAAALQALVALLELLDHPEGWRSAAANGTLKRHRELPADLLRDATDRVGADPSMSSFLQQERRMAR